MKLSVLERIILLSTLPKQGDFATLKLLRVAKEDLSFSDEENTALKFTPVGTNGAITWDTEAGKTIIKEFKFGNTIHALIVSSLKELDEQKSLKEEHFTLYEKFVVSHKEKTSDS